MSIKRTTIRRMSFLSLVFVSVFILSTDARAVMFGFEAISNSSGVSGTLAGQLSLGVTDIGSSQVLFTFYNAGPIDSSIGSMHFDDGALFGIAQVRDADFDALLYPGVYFDEGGSGGNFPEGGTLDPVFETTAGFWAKKDGDAANGVEPTESVGIVFDLDDDEFGDPFTFNDVINAINLGFTYPSDPSWYNESLRIGIHVISIGEKSDSFILTPIPSAVLLGILGLGVAGLKLRKFA